MLTDELAAREIMGQLTLATPDELTPFITHINSQVRLRLASDTRLTEEQVIILAQDSDSFVKGKIARREDLPLLAQQSLVSNGGLMAQKALAANPVTDTVTLIALQGISDDASIHGDIASHRNCSQELQYQIASSGTVTGCRSLAKRADISPETCLVLLERNAIWGDAAIFIELAKNPTVDDSTLKRLAACSTNAAVLEALASNPCAPLSLLVTLSQGNNPSVWANIVGNSNTPQDLIRTIMESHGDESHIRVKDKQRIYPLRESLLNNPNAPRDILEELQANYLNGNTYCRIVVAEARTTPMQTLIRLAYRDKSETVRECAADTLLSLDDTIINAQLASGTFSLSNTIGKGEHKCELGNCLLGMEMSDLYQRIQSQELAISIANALQAAPAEITATTSAARRRML